MSTETKLEELEKRLIAAEHKINCMELAFDMLISSLSEDDEISHSTQCSVKTIDKMLKIS